MTPLSEFAALMDAHEAQIVAQREGVSRAITYPLDRVVHALKESVKNRLRPPSKRKRNQ